MWDDNGGGEWSNGISGHLWDVLDSSVEGHSGSLSFSLQNVSHMEVILLSRFSKVVVFNLHGIEGISGVGVFGVDGGEVGDEVVIVSDN